MGTESVGNGIEVMDIVTTIGTAVLGVLIAHYFNKRNRKAAEHNEAIIALKQKIDVVRAYPSNKSIHPHDIATVRYRISEKEYDKLMGLHNKYLEALRHAWAPNERGHVYMKMECVTPIRDILAEMQEALKVR
ncbi:TPA: hypothetical protein ACNOH7_001975 [Vibrio fluvialis]